MPPDQPSLRQQSTRDFARQIADEIRAKMEVTPPTPTGYDQALGCIAWPAGYAAGMGDARAIVASAVPLEDEASEIARLRDRLTRAELVVADAARCRKSSAWGMVQAQANAYMKRHIEEAT